MTDEEVRVEARLYRRDLPGGGFVAIELTKEVDGNREIPRTRVCVERRLDSARRAGHQCPIIADVDGDRSVTGFADLYNIAADNVAIARALLDWQRRPRAD